MTRSWLLLALVAGAGLVCAGTGAIGLWAALALALWTIAWPDSRSRLAALPPAALSLALAVVLVGLGADLLGLSASSPAAARLCLALLLVPPLVLGLVRPPSRHFAAPGEWAAAAPAVLLLGIAGLVRLLPGWYQTDWLLLGNDSIEHVLYVGRVQQAGGLDYSVEAYPIGVHQFIALLVSADGGQSRTPAGLTAALQITATMTWCMYALMTVALGLAAVSLARSIGLAAGPAALAGAAAGAIALTGSFFSFSMAFGFVTTVGLGAVLAVVLNELARGEGPNVEVLLVATALTAHVWQLAWPLAVLGLFLAAVDRRLTRRSAARLLVSGVAVVGVSAPALFAVGSQVPTTAIAAPGAVAPLSPVWAALAVAAVFWMAVLAASRPRLRTLVLFVLGSFCFALAVGWRAGSPLGYYPRKLLWHAVLLAVPVICVGAVRCLQVLLERVGPTQLLRRPAVLVAALVLVSAPTPLMAASGGWTRSDGLMAAVREDAERPEGSRAPLGSPPERTVIGRLRAYYRPVS